MSRESFIDTYLPYAMSWSRRTGIPPEVYLAIGASESNWGAAGTIFGIKGASPSGQSQTYQTWEYVDGRPVQTSDTFATYTDPNEAFAHFHDLISSGRYAGAWSRYQQTGDWYQLLRDINDSGYATDPAWAEKITDLTRSISPEIGNVPARLTPATGSTTRTPPPQGPGEWEGSAADQIEKTLFGLVSQAPNRANYSNDLDYAADYGLWIERVNATAASVATLRAAESGFLTLPDGTILPRGQVSPEVAAAIDRANQNVYLDFLNQFNLQQYSVLRNIEKDERDRLNDDFRNRMDVLGMELDIGKMDLTRAIADVERYLDTAQEARERAAFIESERRAADRYGTSGGKTSFTYADLGLQPFLYGGSPNDVAIAYPGYRAVDPEATLLRQQQQLGLTGGVPSLPAGRSYSIPGAPLLPSSSVQPPTFQTPQAPASVARPAPAGTPSPSDPQAFNNAMSPITDALAGLAAQLTSSTPPLPSPTSSPSNLEQARAGFLSGLTPNWWSLSSPSNLEQARAGLLSGVTPSLWSFWRP